VISHGEIERHWGGIGGQRPKKEDDGTRAGPFHRQCILIVLLEYANQPIISLHKMPMMTKVASWTSTVAARSTQSKASS
jgi:hypothetical protein